MRGFVAALALVAASNAAAQGFDHQHKAWDALLKKHVVLIEDRKAGLRFLEYDWALNDAGR